MVLLVSEIGLLHQCPADAQSRLLLLTARYRNLICTKSRCHPCWHFLRQLSGRRSFSPKPMSRAEPTSPRSFYMLHVQLRPLSSLLTSRTRRLPAVPTRAAIGHMPALYVHAEVAIVDPCGFITRPYGKDQSRPAPSIKAFTVLVLSHEPLICSCCSAFLSILPQTDWRSLL